MIICTYTAFTCSKLIIQKRRFEFQTTFLLAVESNAIPLLTMCVGVPFDSLSSNELAQDLMNILELDWKMKY